MAEEKKGFFKGLMDKMTGAVSAADDETAEPKTDDENKSPGFFERLKTGLTKTHENLVGRIDELLLGKKQIDADTLDELEEILICADIGVATTMELIRTLEQRLKRNELQDPAALKLALKEEMLTRLCRQAVPFAADTHSPCVIMVIGVNGVGKTTTIGKLAGWGEESHAGSRGYIPGCRCRATRNLGEPCRCGGDPPSGRV
jgi:fused signal recognition particle receptor